MPAVVARTDGAGWQVEGSWPDAELANRFLAHLAVRAFAPVTVRAYAYDLVNFGRFCVERGVRVVDAVPTDLFDYLEWQTTRRPARGGRVVRLAVGGPALLHWAITPSGRLHSAGQTRQLIATIE